MSVVLYKGKKNSAGVKRAGKRRGKNNMKVKISYAKNNVVPRARRGKQFRRIRRAVKLPNGRVYGHGDYAGFLDGALGERREGQGFVNKAVEVGATALGDFFMPGLGATLGSGASKLAKWLGFGDYKLQGNSLLAGCANSSRPNFGMRPGEIRVCWNEYVQDITTSTPTFTNINFLINPGNALLFPWLSTMAANFEEYEIHGMIFEYKSTSSVAFSGTSPAVGSITMATDYDVIDANFADLQEMEISQFSTTDAPYNTQFHAIECDRKKSILTKMYIQPYSVIADYIDDPRFSVFGNFQIATSGIPAQSPAAAVGKLYVTYDITLRKPQLTSQTFSSSRFVQHSSWVNTNGVNSNVINNAVQPIANGALSITFSGSGNSAKVLLSNGPNTQVSGYILLYLQASASSTGVAPPGSPTITSTNVAYPNLCYSSSGTVGGVTANFSGTSENNFQGYANSYSTTFIANVETPSSWSITFPVSVSSSSGTTFYYDMFITQLPIASISKKHQKNKLELEMDSNSKLSETLRSDFERMKLDYERFKRSLLPSDEEIYPIRPPRLIRQEDLSTSSKDELQDADWYRTRREIEQTPPPSSRSSSNKK